MLSRDSLDSARPAKEAALDAVATVVVRHLRDEVTTPKLREDARAPVLVHIGGPGKSQLLGELGRKLDPLAESCDGADGINGWGEVSERPNSAPAARGSNGERTPEEADSSTAETMGDGQVEWSAIRFDAWQYQRVAPPWWWLISAIDRQLRLRFKRRSWRRWLRKRIADVSSRTLQFIRDVVWVVPGILAFLLGWWLSQLGMRDFLEAIATVIGGLAALIGALATILVFGSSIANALRRHLLAESPRGARALLRNTDPMADLLRRYRFLVRTAETPIVVLIDNLDRCRAAYVVEMLEGIQTLLRVPASQEPRSAKAFGSLLRRLRLSRVPKPPPLVAFVVAAEQDWLCDSYLRVYEEFANTRREPGRPFGLAFLDKIFDVSLRLPMVPSTAQLREDTWVDDGRSETSERDNRFANCHSELEVRQELRRAEFEAAQLQGHETVKPETMAANADVIHSDIPPVCYSWRIEAVKRLGELEIESGGRQCTDTADVLTKLLAAADLGPTVAKQLEAAYCVQRTGQLLSGHAVDDDPNAIGRLGLWTLLELRWPLLAVHLMARPNHLERLSMGFPPDGIHPEVAPLFSQPAAVRLAAGLGRVRLTSEDVQRFSTPLSTNVSGGVAGHAPSTTDAPPVAV